MIAKKLGDDMIVINNKGMMTRGGRTKAFVAKFGEDILKVINDKGQTHIDGIQLELNLDWDKKEEVNFTGGGYTHVQCVGGQCDMPEPELTKEIIIKPLTYNK